MERYARQEMIPNWDQHLLSRATLLVIGSGTLARMTSLLAAAMGFGRIALLGDGRARDEDRRFLLSDARAGSSLVRSWAAALEGINPEVQIDFVHDLPCKRSFGKVGRADVIVEASSDPGSKAEVMCLAQAMGSCLLTAAAGPRVGLYQAGAPLSRDFLAFRGAAEDPLVSLMLAALVVEEARRARMPLGPWDRPATEPVMVSPEGLHRRAGGGEGSLVPRKTNGSTRISLVGAGALGTWAAVGLGLANGTPMRMRIFDADPISATNLNRQVLFEGKVNRPKSTVMADRLSAMFPQIEASGEVAAVDHGNLADAFDADAVLSAPDNFSTRALLHQGSLTSGTPLVNGGTSAFGADVAAYVPGSSPCLECSMRVAHVAEAVGEAEERARCAGVAEASVVTSNALAGALMAYEARAALAGRPARGVIEYDGRAPTTRLGVRSVREPCDCHKAAAGTQ